MLSSLLLHALPALGLALSAAARPSSYAVWAADSAIARKQGNGLANGAPKADYTHGTLWFALRRLYEKTGNGTYADYVQASADNALGADGQIGGFKVSEHQLDPIRTGPAFIWLSGRLGQVKYVYAARNFSTALDVQPRTPAGQFWHKQAYKNQGWLDGAYMGYVFYANYYQTWYPYNNTAWNDILKQYTLMYDNTLVTSGTYQGLLYHGYDASKTAVWASSDRGHSPEVWDRAVGWYAMALVDTIDILGQAAAEDDTPQRVAAALKTQLQSLAGAVAKAADPTSGVWWLVITQPGREGNYFESSGAVMYIYAFLRGIRLGYIKDVDGSIVKAMRKAFDYAVKTWVVEKSDGTMDWKNTVSVGSLNTSGDYAYYIAQSITLNDLKGVASFILAALEIEAIS